MKISLEFNSEKIVSVRITGDFFLHPENGIELIENSLKGKKLEKSMLMTAIEKAIAENNLVPFGISSEGIADAVLLAKGNSK